jgi:outer membrane lipoprotein-sorting protein
MISYARRRPSSIGAERLAAFVISSATGAQRAGARTRQGAHAMLRKTLLMGIAMLALLAPITSAQTVDELLAKSFEARGGLKKLKAVQSTRMTAKMVLPQGIEIPMTMVQKRPNSFRMEFNFQGMVGVQAYDGKTAWAVMPMMGKKDPEVMGEDDSKMAVEQSDMDGPLMDYKQKGNTVELVGKEQVEGADAYKLKVTLKNGELRHIYLDAETYLEIKSEAKRTVKGTEVESESYMGDYKEVDGMMTPFAIESGSQRQKIVIEKVELGVALPDSLFGMPAVAHADSATAAAPDTSKAAPAKAAVKKAGDVTKKK